MPDISKAPIQRSLAPMNDSYPILLRVSQTVQPNAEQETQSLAMMNPSGEPMEIRSFLFSAFQAEPSIQTLANIGGMYSIALRVAGKPLTNGPIPMWNFGPAISLGGETVFEQAPVGGIRNTSIASYRWMLDRPLYIPAGVSIEVSIRSTGSFSKPVTVGVTASGSVVPHKPKPSRVDVPWVCVYASKSFNWDEEGSDASPETQLINPFDVPLEVSRFVGRINQLTDYFAGDLSSNDTTEFIIPSVLGLYGQTFKVKMNDSSGNPVVRVATMFRNVFEAKNRSWELGVTLAPRQYYKIFLEKGVLAGASLVAGIKSSRASVVVSMVGCRKEQL